MNYLLMAVDGIRLRLEQHLNPDDTSIAKHIEEIEQKLAAIATQFSSPPALESLCQTFELSAFERQILLLCVAPALIPNWPELYSQVQTDSSLTQPTFSFALKLFDQPHWSAFQPNAPLRYLHLIHLGTGDIPTRSPLQIDETILNYLCGEPYFDAALDSLLQPPSPIDIILPPTHQKLVDQLVGAWSGSGPVPILHLCHSEAGLRQTIATALCHYFGLSLFTLDATALPTNLDDLSHLRRRWERQSRLIQCVLLVVCDRLNSSDNNRMMALSQWCDRLNTPLILSSDQRIKLGGQGRSPLRFDIPTLPSSEQRQLWEMYLGKSFTQSPKELDVLVSQFDLSPMVIRSVCEQAKVQSESSVTVDELWDLCRAEVRPHLDHLAQRIDATVTWEDLVLPEWQRSLLQEMAIHLRQRLQVYRDWGFDRKGDRGLGVSVLFHGASGTGKTLAAEVLAREFHLDLYRIDLSSVVSKYIGETEKNLRQIFDAADKGGVMLLFDEADALFGKRTEVKDSHDRHANIEVSYLLQRMEAYRGVSILTSNYKAALDKAFLRRLRFVVAFPFPSASERVKIWQRAFPSQTLLNGVDFQRLGQLEVAGGNIRNIALSAAFFAAEDNEKIDMRHLLAATEREYLKLERLLTEKEIEGWFET